MELRHLRYFVVLAEELHFGRAAERLFVAQPALSNTVRQLEQDIGCQLFHRTTRRVELTPAGEAFLPRARELLSGVDAAAEIAREAQRRETGTLSLRIGTDVEPVCGPIIEQFMDQHPGIRVDIHASHDDESVEAIERHRADAVFIWEQPTIGHGIKTIEVKHEPLLLALPAAHRLSGLDVIPRAELEHERVVLFPREHGPAVYDSMLGQLTADGGSSPEVFDALRGPSGQREMLAAVARGEGVAPVTSYLFELAARPDLVLRPVTPPVSLAITLAWSGEPSRPLAALIRMIQGRTGDSAAA